MNIRTALDPIYSMATRYIHDEAEIKHQRLSGIPKSENDINAATRLIHDPSNILAFIYTLYLPPPPHSPHQRPSPIDPNIRERS